MTDSSVSLSVVIPTFNAADTLAEALGSLRAQTRRDWEAIVVDDGSSDQTIALAGSFIQRDSRFRLIRASHRGVSATRNSGIEAAIGRLLLFLDADDWIAPTYVETMLAALERATDAAAAYCAYRRVLPDRSMTSAGWAREIESAPFETFARRSGTAIHCVVIEKELVVELGGFDPSLQTCEDWDLWQRVARTGAVFVGVREELAFYRSRYLSLSTDGE
jgi:glycosyltransferase involved in cell wall biosynthesis